MDHKQFYAELQVFREKFPMVYIEAWQPDDWQQYLTPRLDADEDDEYDTASAKPPDWSEPIHIEIAERLSKTMNAEYGTNWDSLKMAVEDVTENHEQTVHPRPE